MLWHVKILGKRADITLLQFQQDRLSIILVIAQEGKRKAASASKGIHILVQYGLKLLQRLGGLLWNIITLHLFPHSKVLYPDQNPTVFYITQILIPPIYFKYVFAQSLLKSPKQSCRLVL